MLAGAGLQTAGIAFGGDTPPSTAIAESYDGSSWTEVGDLNTARIRLGGAGLQTAALAFGGYVSANSALTEEFNFTAMAVTAGAWSSSNSMNTGRSQGAGCGTQTAALAISGRRSGSSPDADIANVESYDGSSWTEGPDVNSPAYNRGGAGPSTAAVVVGGNSDVGGAENIDKTEEYDGSSWTQGGTLSRRSERLGVFGIQTSCVACGGADYPHPNFNDITEEYNGTAWTAYPSVTISADIAGMMAAGTETAGVIWGGNGTGIPTVQTTQEYNGSAWTTGNNTVLTVSDGAYGSIGSSQTSAFSVSGQSPGNGVQHYDGTVWRTAPSIGTSRTSCAGAGSVPAGLVFMGNTAPTTRVGNTEEFTPDTTSLNLKTITDS